MAFRSNQKHTTFEFRDLKTLMGAASPLRSGDQLAGLAASSAQERVVAQMILADLPLQVFLDEPLIAPEQDEVSRLILETHNIEAFAPVKNLSVGQFRDWLLDYDTTGDQLRRLAPGITPEMVAAVSKLMGNQDLIRVASKCRVVTKFRNTIGLPGRLSVRLQPNHPTDNPRGVAASILDGLLMGCGDAVIGINPATDSVQALDSLTKMLAELIETYEIPTQSCVLSHITSQIQAIERGLPVDLIFQSIAGTQAANASFGIDLKLLQEGLDAGRSLNRGTVGNNVLYFETGQGSCLSANAHHGVDQQTLETRAYAVARHFEPLLVNTVVGFIGPEYLYDGKQIIRAGLEDHFCGKLLGLPMGCDICYTNHAEADQDDMDNLLVLLGAAGCNYIMGVPGADDVMLGYQSTSFHDADFLRETLGLRPAPEFESWLQERGVINEQGRIQPVEKVAKSFLIGEQDSATHLPFLDKETSQLRNRWALETEARILLPRAGGAVALNERLDFHFSHANARDAVQWPFDPGKLVADLEASGAECMLLQSAAQTKAEFLQRPDLGRKLNENSRLQLQNWRENRSHSSPDLVLIVSDGLSAHGVEKYGAFLISKLRLELVEGGYSLAPVCIVERGRVALQDEIGELLGVRLALTLIGERPGLGTPDSLGAYFVFNPRVGNNDSQRNCVSNIRDGGLLPQDAVAKIIQMVVLSLRSELSGVALKDDIMTRCLQT